MLDIVVNLFSRKKIEQASSGLEQYLKDEGYLEHPGNQDCSARYFVNDMDIVCIAGEKASWTWHNRLKANGTQEEILTQLKAYREQKAREYAKLI